MEAVVLEVLAAVAEPQGVARAAGVVDLGQRLVRDEPCQELAGGLGAVTHISVKIGRRYTAGGVKRSYVSARCGDHILRSHGAFTFPNGLVIEGVGLEKYCAQRP